MVLFLYLNLLLIIFIISYEHKQVVKRNIILGITLPLNQLNNSDVLKILSEYKKVLKKYIILLFFISTISYLFFYNNFNLYFNFFIIFVFSLPIIQILIVKKYNLKMKSLKEKSNWIVGQKNIVPIDIKLTSLKNTMVLPSFFFIPIFILCIIIFIIGVSNFKKIPEILYLSIINLIFNLTFYWLYTIFKKSKIKIYSNNEEINYTLNKYEKYLFSNLFVNISFIFTLSSLISTVALLNNSKNYIIILFFPLSIIFIILFYICYYKINKAKDSILSLDKNPIIIDEDDYWKYGLFYYNPYNKNKFIENRIGIGMTYNIPHKVNFIIYFVIALLSFLLVFYINIGEKTNIDIYEKNNLINIDFPMYSVKISKNEIEKVKVYENNVKIISKINGYGTEKKSIGTFRVSLNNSNDIYKLFINNENINKVILIDLKDKPDILLNGKDNNETSKMLQLIKNFIEQ